MADRVTTAGRQLSLPTPLTWGGRRAGAGRKPSGRRVGVSHRRRPVHKARHPVHVTLRATVACLRSGRVFPVIMRAISDSRRSDFRVVQFSVQANHLHLLLEASGPDVLARGIRGLIVRTARAVNRALGRAGPVWTGRYHRHDLKTPAEVRNCLKYILDNWKKHVAGAAGVDPCSSGPWFDGWHDHAGPAPAPGPRPVALPRTWLASAGWRLHGLLRTSEPPVVAPRRARRPITHPA